MHLWCFRFKWDFLLVAQASEVTIFVADLALELPGRTLDPLYMLWITTLQTSISSLMGLVRIKSFLGSWHIMVVFTSESLVTLWFWLVRVLFPLALTWWEVCSLMPHEISFSCLRVTCNLFYMPCSRLWRFHLLGKLSHLAWWELLQINVRIIDDLENKILIFQENTKYISVQDLSCSRWVLGKRHLSLNSIVTFIYRMIALSKACQQVKSCSNVIGLWFDFLAFFRFR